MHRACGGCALCAKAKAREGAGARQAGGSDDALAAARSGPAADRRGRALPGIAQTGRPAPGTSQARRPHVRGGQVACVARRRPAQPGSMLAARWGGGGARYPSRSISALVKDRMERDSSRGMSSMSRVAGRGGAPAE